MGQAKTRRAAVLRACLGVCALSLFLSAFSASALGAPFHPRTPSLDITGLNHACGVATDSKGDLYASSAATSAIKVYNPSHVLLTEIADANTPCGLAVTTTGVLYVSEQATGKVVRFKPNKYPFEGTPTYGEREEIDKSGKAKGIAVDPKDNRLYVAAGDHIAVYKSDGSFEVNVGEGALSEATGVAPYTYANGTVTDRYLWVADARGIAADELYLFSALGTEVGKLALRRKLNGSTTPDGSFEFGKAGAYLATDPGNRNSENKCVAVGGKQACSAGHLFLYDAAHKALDEFDVTGSYLDRTTTTAFADAEPTQVAIERSGIEKSDGTVYVSAGAGSGARVLAFGPLEAPSRKTLEEPIAHKLEGAQAVATDSHGNVYAVALNENVIHVYTPTGTEIAEFEDEGKPIDLAVDSAGNVYVLDERNNFPEAEVTYYEPSSYPPEAGTEYARHEPPVVLDEADFPEKQILKGIAVNPGPGSGKDRLYVTSANFTQVYDSAANGSGLLDSEFGKCVGSLVVRQSIAVDGPRGIVYIAINTSGSGIFAVDEASEECIRRFDSKGAPSGKSGPNPYLAVDQANGHVIEYDNEGVSSLREYDGAGSFLAEFGKLTEFLGVKFRVAVDNSCALHEPPLDETTEPTCKAFDPANGNVYLAYADTSPKHPPYNGVNAFGPLSYPGEAPPPIERELTVKKTGKGSGKVTSEPSGIDCGSECAHKFNEYLDVILTPKPAEGSVLKKWTGCDSVDGEGKCLVTMSSAREVEAEFESTETEEFELTVKKTGKGSGKVTSEPSGIDCGSKCTHLFLKNTEVVLTAKPDAGSEFLGWSGPCKAETVAPEGGTCTLTVTEGLEVKAEFDILHPLLTVIEAGAGTGTVTSSPAGIDCGSTCSAKFELHKHVTLTAVADPGSVFAGWDENDCDFEPGPSECEVTMEEARQVTVSFARLPQTIAKPASPIAYTEATLHGEVDPSGLPAEYQFDYLTEQEYDENGETFEGAQHTPTGKLGAAEGPIAVEAPLFGLDEGTAYRFRLRAMSSVGPSEDEGPPFATLQRRPPEVCANTEYRSGPSAGLPDCRAYELVTPAQTDGLTPYAVDNVGRGSFSNWLTVQAGEGAGERLSYFTDGTLPGFEGNGRIDGYRAQRGAGEHPEGGWQSALFSPSFAEAAPGFTGAPAQLGVASDQLYSSWEVRPEPGFPEALEEGVYLRTPTGFEVLGRGSLGEDLGAHSRFVSAGGAHAIFDSEEHLEPDAPPQGNLGLYDRLAGSATAEVLTVPPEGATEEEEEEFFAALRSKEQSRFSGASEDGSAAVFTAGVALYAHVEDGGTERLSPEIARVGDTLDCAAGPLYQGSKKVKERLIEWLRNAKPISGTSGGDLTNKTTYGVQAADEGASLQCLTVATVSEPRSVAVSAPIWIEPLKAGEAPRPPTKVPAPEPSSPAVGTVETCNPGSWEGAKSLAYQWYRDGKEIAGATAQTYKVQAADVPGTLQCIVSGSNTAATVARASGLTSTSPAPAEAALVATAQAAVQATYAGASDDGRYVFFALGEGKAPSRLFRFDTGSEIAEEIAAAGIFAGVSSGGDRAFFSSTEALSGGEENDNGETAEEGARNLYAWEEGGIRFLARLSADDFKQNAFADISKMNLAAWTEVIGFADGAQSGRALAPTRSSADGGVFVFQSHAQLTSYENEGRGEIYRYDPSAAVGERLLCVSCAPSGAPPSADALLEDVRSEVGVPIIQTTTTIANLTSDGEAVFFQSFDRLLPEDANDVEDVYEWRANGSGNCTRSGGCLGLVSSGQGDVQSLLYAMSADGHDVFIHTREKLVGADVAGSPSIYDARVGGGIPEPPEPEPCQGDACQGEGSEPPLLPSLGSGGVGESPEAVPRPKCAKGKHRVKGRCVPIKHRKRHRHRRAHHANRGGNR